MHGTTQAKEKSYPFIFTLFKMKASNEKVLHGSTDTNKGVSEGPNRICR